MRKLCLGLSFFAMAVFVACDGSGTNANSELLGNSSNSSSESFDEYDGEVEYADDLPKCTAKKDEKVYYVEDEDIAYTCRYDGDEETGEWVRKKKKSADDGSSSSNVKPDGSVVKGTLTDSRDGQVYRTTTIDIPAKSYSEVWMAENLNFVTENSWCGGSGTTEGDCSIYGRLYKWAAAVAKPEDECGYGHECSLGTGDIRGVCPKGWHLPSYDEWNELITAVGGSSVAGKVLKSETGWQSYSGIENSDTYLFSALPAGYRNDDGNYSGEGSNAYFWSSTEHYGSYAYYMYVGYGYDYYEDAYLYDISKDYGFSVRCLKD